jgi:UDP-N-acetylglucosamine--N-acetylmuramyl-(pentapeptide) pyrophosphoryl-undecaprenol N-acetylglucosamine transferase
MNIDVKNAGVLVKDSEAKADMITSALNLLSDKQHQSQLSENIKTLGRQNAAERIAKEVLKLVKE